MSVKLENPVYKTEVVKVSSMEQASTLNDDSLFLVIQDGFAHKVTAKTLRESIYKLKPAGWHGGGFYERSHLLMWKLSGINDLRNLVTGTAKFNEDNMQDYEKKVTAYLWDHDNNHVMYRVTPVYKGDELLCRGVLMEAYSVEDHGKLEYCVFVYNAEPGATIDYLTGDFMIEAN